jgi:hypothetical protein
VHVVPHEWCTTSDRETQYSAPVGMPLELLPVGYGMHIYIYIYMGTLVVCLTV